MIRTFKVGIAATAVAATFCFSLQAQTNQVVHGNFVVATRSTAIGEPPGTKRLNLAVALPLRNRETLTNLLRDIYDPRSPRYRRFLTPEQFAEQFGPSEADYQAVIAFAKSHGLQVTDTHPNRALLDVSGTVADIERALHINLKLHQHPKEERTYYAPDAEPTIELSVPILSIDGLDDYVIPRPMGLRTNLLDQPTKALSYATGSGPRGNFIGRDFRAAFAPDVTWDGAGESVGLIEFDTYHPNDIAAYEDLGGLPHVVLSNVFVNDFGGPPGPNNIEVALDIDMVMAMAPGISRIIVYQGFIPNDIFNRMATDNAARQLSCSWGFGQLVDPAREQIFMQYAAQGQSFFQASGDLGAWNGPILPPSDEPLATVVGGTILTTTNPSSAWVSETVWPPGGGGISTIFPIPSWQQPVNMSSNQGSATMRNIPDVACLADAIWVIVNNGEQGIVGGTSASAPLWAGYMALVNQQAAAENKSGIGFANPALYDIGLGTNYTFAFHDITTGNNTNDGSGGKFLAFPGFDLCTGWGTPTGSGLIDALLGPSDALQIAPEAVINFSGPTGGPFNPLNQTLTLSNGGTLSLNWAVGNPVPWLAAIPASGTLSAGSSAAVSLATTTAATNLSAGTYAATVSFTNLTSGLVQNRQVILVVTPPSVTTPGAIMTTLYSFTGGIDGGGPNGLLLASNGLFYGTTQNGGTNFAGTVFQLATNGSLSTLYAFTGGPDGANPFAPFEQGLDGNFYGSTFQGGATDNGTLFRVTPSGALATLVTFNIGNGDFPYARLLRSGSNFFGTSYQGGAFGRGTVFRMATNGALATVFSFSNGADGSHPSGNLAQGSDGHLYGTTYKGGASGRGTVFQLRTNGELNTLLSFNSTNGAFPFAGLTKGDDGSFYGVTTGGGNSNNGTIFKITATGLHTNLYSFTGGTDGGNPRASLLLASDGNFYGTTTDGGNSGKGTIFAVSSGGTLSTLVHFTGPNGANPQATLAQDGGGNIYGTTQRGGAAERGTIFKFTVGGGPQITGQPTGQSVFAGTDVAFSVSVLGQSPLSFQWLRNGTNLSDGGNLSGSQSRVLHINNSALSNAANYSVVVSNSLGAVASESASLSVTSSPPFIVTQPTNQTVAPGATVAFRVSAFGNVPLSYYWSQNGKVLTNAGNVSGQGTDTLTIGNATEANNGTYTVLVSNSIGTATSTGAVLTVIPVSAPGTRLTTLHWFNATNDRGPVNGLALGTNGNLYSTTQLGGPTPSGTAFSLTPDGTYTILATFSATSGTGPSAPLVQGKNGDFFGTARFRGALEGGTIYRLSPTGSLAAIYSFMGDTDGYDPKAILREAADGALYGAMNDAGDNFLGSVFRFTPSGVFTNIYSFTGANDGFNPRTPLTIAADGNLYGTADGGISGSGTVFRLSTNGTLTTLHSFDGGPDGGDPVGGLVQGTDGYLYGAMSRSTTNVGGMIFANNGTLFKISTNGEFTTLHLFKFTDGSQPEAGLIQSSDGNFYGTTFSGGNDANGTLFRMTPDGTVTRLLTFDDFDTGRQPLDALVEGLDGALYGTTSTGGPGGRGTIFRLSFTGAPQITGQPSNRTAVAGSPVSFSVASFGAPPLTYQWRKDGTNLADNGNVAGAANRIVALANVTPADGGNYSVLVSNALGSVTSSNAFLTVIQPPVFQSITHSNGIITLIWSTVPGQRYQLQFKPDLEPGTWLKLGTILTATNNTLTASDTFGPNLQRFYRVARMP